MTGFGREEITAGAQTVVFEIRSLNSKLADVRIKTSLQLSRYELELRKLVLDRAIRGKLDVTLEVREEGVVSGMPDPESVRVAYRSLRKIADDIGASEDALFSTVLRLPGIVQSDDQQVDERTWELIRSAANAALDKLETFRTHEGRSLYKDLRSQVEGILDLLGRTDAYDGERTEALRQRLSSRFKEIAHESVDKNRFEQEVLYYLEKLDVNEEKVRLEQHCRHFLDILDSESRVKGKKLNFVSQEIGREINTLGAKAQWSPLQRLVVQMKDNLEQVKEQLANVL